MGVISLVVTLAAGLRQSGIWLTPEDRERLALLEAMPQFGRGGRLDLWDEAVRKVPEGDARNELVDAIWDLAGFNLYAAFQADKTLTQYRRLQALFAEAGVTTPEVAAIPDW